MIISISSSFLSYLIDEYYSGCVHAIFPFQTASWASVITEKGNILPFKLLNKNIDYI